MNSFILSPGTGGMVPAERTTTIRGVAFNDGEAAIDRVEVSCDDGKSWHRAALEKPASPYAWTRWSFPTLFGKGTFRVWSRATDRLGRTQPLDGTIDWNPHGYEWNGVDRIEITAG